MNYEEFIRRVDACEIDKIFTGGATQVQIGHAEEVMGISFPDDYIIFLNRYGHGCVAGLQIYGCGKNDKSPVVSETLRMRDFGLPKHLLVIDNVGDYSICLDTSKNEHEGTPVVKFTMQGEIMSYGVNFFDYVDSRISDAEEDEDIDL